MVPEPIDPVEAARKAVEVPNAALAATLRAQAAALVAVADVLESGQAAAPAPSTAPRYATAKRNPWGSARAFHDRARAGLFPTFKIGREVAALWSECERAIEGSTRRRDAKPANDAAGPPKNDADRDALLARAGVPMRRTGGAR